LFNVAYLSKDGWEMQQFWNATGNRKNCFFEYASLVVYATVLFFFFFIVSSSINLLQKQG